MNQGVSIIIPCFNQGIFLHDALLSVLSNRHVHEIIIINDGSTDSLTIREIDRIARSNFSKVKIRHKANGGLSSARNLGLAIATGEYIQFLDSDDMISPMKFELQLTSDMPKFDVAISSYYTADQQLHSFSEQLSATRFALTTENIALLWERGMSIPIHCALFRRAFIKGIYFNFLLKAKEDWLFWIEVSTRLPDVTYSCIPLAIYRISNHNMTRDKKRMAKSYIEAVEKIQRRLPLDLKNRFIVESDAWFKHYYLDITGLDYDSKQDVQRDFEFAETYRAYTNKWIMQDLSNSSTVDVLIPAFGHYAYLAECISTCCLANPSGNVFLYDDKSAEFIKHQLLYLEMKTRYPNFHFYISDENHGICYAQDQLVQQSAAPYVAFVDCDDALPLPSLSYLIERILVDNYRVDYYFTDRIDVTETGQPLRVISYGNDYPKFSPTFNLRVDLREAMVCSHLKCIKRSSIISIGGFSSLHEGVQDFHLAARFIAADFKFEYIKKPIYYHRKHSDSVTSSRASMMLRNSNLVCKEMLEMERSRSEFAVDACHSELMQAYLHKYCGDLDFNIFFWDKSVIKDCTGKARSPEGACVVVQEAMSVHGIVALSKVNILALYIKYNRDDLVSFARVNAGWFDFIVVENPVHFATCVPVCSIEQLRLKKAISPPALFAEIGAVINAVVLH